MISRLKVLAPLIDEVHDWIRPHHDCKQWSSISTSQVNNLAHSRAQSRDCMIPPIYTYFQPSQTSKFTTTPRPRPIAQLNKHAHAHKLQQNCSRPRTPMLTLKRAMNKHAHAHILKQNCSRPRTPMLTPQCAIERSRPCAHRLPQRQTARAHDHAYAHAPVRN